MNSTTMKLRHLFFKLLFFQYSFCVWGRLIPYDENQIMQGQLDTNDVRYGLFDHVNVFSQDVLTKSVQDEQTKIMGLYAGHHVDGDEVEVSVPIRVSRDGSFLSHSIKALHEDTHVERAKRRRRSVDDFEDPDQDLEEIHYNLTVGGRALTLNLRPELGFISPALVVERRGGNAGTRKKAEISSSACHYRGSVRNQPGSTVALSACDGLAGHLRTKHGEYWVEPSLQHTPAREGEAHPHVIYKRSAVGVTYQDNNDKKQKNKKKANGDKGRKGRRKQRERRRKRRRGKNCATKQPPRTAKQVEWMEGPDASIIQETKDQKGHRFKDPRRWPEYRQKNHQNPQSRAPRNSRSVSRARHVEVLLVADSTMSEFHQKENVETYLLTIMNMVSSLYLDPTIGNQINVVVVKIILLEDHESQPHLNITTNADTTLANFCRWQKDLNPSKDEHPNHHDVAILITRKDICARQNVPCSTLGVAHVAGMCQPDRSCSVNEDNGITLAHTITHELGHNFGMYHDTEKIGCHRRVGSILHVMTPIFEADHVEVAWSRCSRRDVTNFLDSGMGECLADQPAQVDYIYPELPPGALYDAAQQCRMQFGEGVEEVCTELNEICQRLWCVVNGTCTTMLRPAAPGTSCGIDMWCQNLECVPQTSPPPPQDGGWGEWSPWSPCTRTCGAGVSITKRHCNNPAPKNGGKFCVGERTRYEICNTDPCPKNEPSFRQIQCSKYDNQTYDGKIIEKWQPYFDQEDPCELYCSTPDESVIVPFGEYAEDGTPCNLGTRDLCISGICRKVGCDWIVDSNAVEDNCGICNGNGTDCKQIQGIYSMGATKESGYSEVAVIPAGSKNIKVEEMSNSKNYIGIGSANSKKFYLNGRRRITLAGEYLVAGSPALYERDRDWEKIRIPGPIKEDILIYQMIYRGRHRNPGVIYQYTVDNPHVDRKLESEEYRWAANNWTACTKTCGGGYMKQSIVCVDGSGTTVDHEKCISNNEMEKPAELMKVCNTRPCPTYWWVGQWTQCPPCQKLQHHRPMRRRKVLCRDRADNRILHDSKCDARTRPVTHIPCSGLSECDHRH